MIECLHLHLALEHLLLLHRDQRGDQHARLRLTQSLPVSPFQPPSKYQPGQPLNSQMRRQQRTHVFIKVIEKLQKSSARAKAHPSAKRKAAEAQAAAQPPANEKLAGAKANQVDTMKGAETKKPEPDSFLTLLRAEIEKVMPKTLGDTENFMKGDKKEQLKGAMTGNVNQQKEEASGPA